MPLPFYCWLLLRMLILSFELPQGHAKIIYLSQDISLDLTHKLFFHSQTISLCPNKIKLRSAMSLSISRDSEYCLGTLRYGDIGHFFLGRDSCMHHCSAFYSPLFWQLQSWNIFLDSFIAISRIDICFNFWSLLKASTCTARWLYAPQADRNSGLSGLRSHS